MSVNFGSTDGSNPGNCAATLVAANWAITAAHCITEPGATTLSDTKESLSLVLGEFDLSSSTDSDDGKRWILLLKRACPYFHLSQLEERDYCAPNYLTQFNRSLKLY